jgi:hypothetical protein
MPLPPSVTPTHGRPIQTVDRAKSAPPSYRRWTVDVGLIVLFIDLLWWIRR